MQTIPQVAKALQAVLTTEADRAGRQTRFVQRESKVTGSIFTQTLVFGLLANPQASLDNLTQTTAALGVELSPQGLDQRFSREAALCLEQVLTAAIRTVVTTDPVAIPLLERFNGVYLQDRITIVLPPRLAEVWQGCGGSTDHGAAALKLQLQLNTICWVQAGPTPGWPRLRPQQQLGSGAAARRTAAGRFGLLGAGAFG
jgi:hypothetical protein